MNIIPRMFRSILYVLAFISLLLWCGGCAYFNTYYNGKRLFNQARDQTDRQFPDTVKAGAGESANFQKAIDKFAVVMRDHPDSRWTQNSLYHMGLSYYYMGEFPKAERKFQEIWEYYPRSKFAPQARLNAAIVNWRLGDYDRSSTLLIPLRDHPDRRLRERAAYLEALGLHTRGNTAEALIAWDRYLLNFAKGELVWGGRLDYASCLLESGELDHAIRELEIVAAMRAKKTYRHLAWSMLGQAYAKAGRDQDAIRRFRRILAQQPDNATAAETEYQLATVSARSDSAAAAMERYLAVAKKYPSTQASARSYFDMGSLMERQQLPDTALALYRKAKSEAGTGPLAEAALRKASDIALLLSYRKESSQATREQGAVLQFLMAEQYLFGLNLPDSAIATYQRLAAEYPDLPLAPKALLAAAWAMERHQGDSATVLDLYRRIIATYPATRYANGARDRLGLSLEPAVADSEPDIEFKTAAASVPAAEDTLKSQPPALSPDQIKSEEPKPEEPNPGSEEPPQPLLPPAEELKMPIPGPNDQQGTTDKK